MKKNKFKHWLLLMLTKILFRPEITFENEAVQDRILKEPCVIICNHTHILDGPIIRYVFKDRGVCSLMAKDMLERKRWKILVHDCACISVDRDSASMAWLHDCLDAIKDGNSVIIFPEGTTHKEHPIEDFKSGFLLLARSAKVNVLPVAVNGIYRVFTKNKLKIKVGTPQPLHSTALTKKSLQNEAERFQEIVTDMYREFTENYYELEKECF